MAQFIWNLKDKIKHSTQKGFFFKCRPFKSVPKLCDVFGFWKHKKTILLAKRRINKNLLNSRLDNMNSCRHTTTYLAMPICANTEMSADTEQREVAPDEKCCQQDDSSKNELR